MNLIRKPGWAIPEREATPEDVFFGRRRFLLGAAGALAGGLTGAWGAGAAPSKEAEDKTLGLYPAKRNPAFTLDRPLTEEKVAAAFNN
ncbi:MAG: protein-methionine-sulfoxide reductase catalytic subunit MsrP, partial [Candidatus Tectomicrobia bacterium]|nr:protein-methionine-sulfoxide reductase catalytic subunit MsrP [Candidatus Tectomicrobia bacterium]